MHGHSEHVSNRGYRVQCGGHAEQRGSRATELDFEDDIQGKNQPSEIG